jgi:hypothetical protein
MPDREEVLRSLYGAWRLARLDQSGMGYFTLTVEGFWRSFFAAVLVAPGYTILVARELIGRADTFDLGWVVLVQVLAYALSWAAFPLAAVLLIRLFDLSGNYVALIVALNWAAVIQVGLFLAALFLGLAVPAMLGGLLLIIVTVSILFYQWFVTRTALQTSGGVALLLVLVDLVLNTAIDLMAERLT